MSSFLRSFRPHGDHELVALSDGNGQFVLATASFVYRADVGVEGGTLNTARAIALTFAPENRGPRETGGGVRVGWKSNGSDVEVRVEDEGPGLASTANLFVPFFTTKPGGSGIGLAIT